MVKAIEEGKGSAWDGESVAEEARKITLEVFAVDESASVQVRGISRIAMVASSAEWSCDPSDL